MPEVAQLRVHTHQAVSAHWCGHHGSTGWRGATSSGPRPTSAPHPLLSHPSAEPGSRTRPHPEHKAGPVCRRAIPLGGPVRALASNREPGGVW